MGPRCWLSAIAVILAAAVSVPSYAKQNRAKGEKNHLNEVVCEKQEVLGSRLAVKRVCMTRAEWAERKRLDREETERIQVKRGLKGE